MGINQKEISTISDLEIIDRYKNSSDTEYIGELYKRYTFLVFGVCMKYLKNQAESQDAVMSIFEKLVVDLRRHKVENFKGWIYQVARNHCLMDLRKNQTKIKKLDAYKKDSSEEVVEIDDFEHQEDASRKELDLNNMEIAIQALKEEQRVCIELFYLQEKSYNEVADLTGFSLKQVKSYIQNGKRNLKNKLSEQGE